MFECGEVLPIAQLPPVGVPANVILLPKQTAAVACTIVCVAGATVNSFETVVEHPPVVKV